MTTTMRTFGARGAVAAAAVLLCWSFAIPADAQQRREVRPFPMKERCERYQEAFDKEREKLRAHPNYKDAVEHRRLGERFCNTGHTAPGQKVLQCALELVNLAPPRIGEGRRAPKPEPICLEKAQRLLEKNTGGG